VSLLESGEWRYIKAIIITIYTLLEKNVFTENMLVLSMSNYKQHFWGFFKTKQNKKHTHKKQTNIHTHKKKKLFVFSPCFRSLAIDHFIQLKISISSSSSSSSNEVQESTSVQSDCKDHAEKNGTSKLSLTFSTFISFAPIFVTLRFNH